MAESKGWWYDRQKKVFIPVHEHTEAVLKNPERYRVSEKNLCVGAAKLQGGGGIHVWREKIIPVVCHYGFIRVRLIKGHAQNTLAWQFTGEPHDAYEVLKRFIKKHGVGPMVEVTFTDFGLGRTLTTFLTDFNPEKGPLKTFLHYWEFVHAPRKWTESTKRDFRAYSGMSHKDVEQILLDELNKKIKVKS